MRKIIAAALVAAAALATCPTPARADFWGWLSGLLLPANGFPGGSGVYTVEGYFTPETFGQSCNTVLGGCTTGACAGLHFYPPSAPMSAPEAVRLWQIGHTMNCHGDPVVSPRIPGLN